MKQVVCVNNDGYPVSLTVGKEYCVVGNPRPDEEGFVRVIDDSGDSYLYPADRFTAPSVKGSVKERLTAIKAKGLPKLDWGKYLGGDLKLELPNGKVEVAICPACIYLECVAVDHELSQDVNAMRMIFAGEKVNLTPEHARLIADHLNKAADNWERMHEDIEDAM